MDIISIFICTLLTMPGIFQDAEKLYKNKSYDAAMEVAARAAQEAAAAADTTTLIKALCIQADIAIDLGNDAEAIDYYNRCAELCSFGEPKFKLSSSLYNIATIYFQNGEYAKAKEYITKSINIDSQRESDSILALRYLLSAEISYANGDYTEALEYAETGRSLTVKRKNHNVAGRLMLIQARCKEAMAGPDIDWKVIEGEYSDALETLNTMLPGYYFGAVNPYETEFQYHIGRAVAAQGRDARQYFLAAISNSRVSQKMRGVNPLAELESCKALADIYEKEGNIAEAGKYRILAEALSYVPYVHEMGNKLSLSQMEFIRREKEREIERKEEQSHYLLMIVSVLALAVISLLLMYRYQVRQRKQIEEQNAQLVKLCLQKDKLLSMFKQNSPADPSEIKSIAGDNVPFPKIKLSKREIEVLSLCCQGLISKEIASKLDVSVRTVESHKLNICRKVGVNTTNELIAFAFKSGLIK